MTTITIQSNFQAQKVINMLKSDGVKFDSKSEPNIQYGKTANKATLEKIVNTVCAVLGENVKDVKSKYRGGEVVTAKKVYCYIAKTLFPHTTDEVLVSVLTITRSTLTSHKLEVSERIHGKLGHLPENVSLKKSIDRVFELLEVNVESKVYDISLRNKENRLQRILNQ